ncbi:MAG: hypothetical protein WD048_13765 [Chitinophagales bacterium]
MKKLFLFCAFACVGITTEIFFTAITDNITAFQNNQPIDWRLKGQSYIWMFPIYGLAGLLFPIVLKYIGHFHVLLRVSIYGVGILAVEFIAGAALDFFTGQCPWEYTSGWHIMGYIRLDYFPLWAAFGYMIESILGVLDKRT